jgi:hypothetical protein
LKLIGEGREAVEVVAEFVVVDGGCLWVRPRWSLLVVAATSTPVALVGTRGAVLVVVPPSALTFGFLAFPMVVVNVDFFITVVGSHRVARVGGLSLDGEVVLPQALDLSCSDVGTCPRSLDVR